MGRMTPSLHRNVMACRRITGTTALLALVCVLSGCSSTSFSDLPPALGGLPQGVPERPAVQPAYPAVHDMPPQRATAIMTDEELKRAQAELVAARDRQAPPKPAAKSDAKPPAKPTRRKPDPDADAAGAPPRP